MVVLAKKSPFTDEEEQAVESHLSEYSKLAALYLPSQPGSNPFSELVASNDPYAFARRYAYNVSPVDDDAPFFFFTLKLGQVLHGQGHAHGIDWKVNLGVAVLGMVLIISAAAVAALLVAPLLLQHVRVQKHRTGMLYFVAVGLGYILVEIAFIQRFVLFLGHPTYALTVVVFLLLLSSGMGSLFSARWTKGRERLPIVVISAALIVYVFVLPALLHGAVGLPFLEKLVVSGFVFCPSRSRYGHAISQRVAGPCPCPGCRPDNAVEWAWALNAASSVTGSVLAMVIAIQFGLNVTLACGAAAYVVAWRIHRRLPVRQA